MYIIIHGTLQHANIILKHRNRAHQNVILIGKWVWLFVIQLLQCVDSEELIQISFRLFLFAAFSCKIHLVPGGAVIL